MPVSNVPCGSWPSPITPGALATASLRFSDCRLLPDGTAFWAEGRPAEGGRTAVMRRRPGERPEELAPGLDARSRVHEYGGGAFVVADGRVFVVHAPDQTIHEIAPGRAPRRVTAPSRWRFGDLAFDAARRRLVCVGELHGEDGPVENAVVAVRPHDGEVEVVAGGHDFFAAPAPSPDGRWLAWLSWDHPHMPWDAAALWIAPLGGDGRPRAPALVAGGPGRSAAAPGWTPDGALVFALEDGDFWNLHRWRDGSLAAICPTRAEFARPLWSLGARTWGPLAPGRLAAACADEGRWRLGTVDVGARAFAPLDGPAVAVEELAAAGGRILSVTATPERGPAVELVDVQGGSRSVLRTAGGLELASQWISRGQQIRFETEDGGTGHAFLYPPRHPECAPLSRERPPLLVVAHGGPTSAATAAFSLAVQFWTTRGIAVLDVNYRGSTGYGRRYREALRGRWGVVDVADCVAAARNVAGTGAVDPARMAIRGASAGGFTALAALSTSDVFAAAASYYGVSDPARLAVETHKFESHYLEALIGPYPQARALYEERAPLRAVDRIAAPVIFFQGLEDRVVPPSQAEGIVAALRARGLAAEHHAFPGEQHGFRMAETIRKALELELAFYGRRFGFTPAAGP